MVALFALPQIRFCLTRVSKLYVGHQIFILISCCMSAIVMNQIIWILVGKKQICIPQWMDYQANHWTTSSNRLVPCHDINQLQYKFVIDKSVLIVRIMYIHNYYISLFVSKLCTICQPYFIVIITLHHGKWKVVNDMHVAILKWNDYSVFTAPKAPKLV